MIILTSSTEHFESLIMSKNGSFILKEGNEFAYGKLLNNSLYSENLKNWLKYFPLQQFLFLSTQQFIGKPYEELKKVERFLGLKPFFNETKFVYDKEKGFYCINRSDREGKVKCLGENKGREHPIIDENVLKKLKSFYEPYNKELFELIKQKPFWPI